LTEPLIGLFLNTLVIRLDLSGDPTFYDILTRVRQVVLEAYTHQDLPFERLVDMLQPERDLGRSPLFQAMMVLQEQSESFALPDLKITPMALPIDSAKFELSLAMARTPTGLRGWLEHRNDLFDAACMERMAEHLQVLLRAIAANPHRRLSHLPLLTESERREILIDWNDTSRSYPDAMLVRQLFERQVERAPDRVALTFEGHTLTYAELNSRSNQLAHYLQERGVGPDVLVGICLERSLDLIIALLGILKAGGGFVPVDPSYPDKRIRFMLEDAGVQLVLTRSDCVKHLSEQAADLIVLDRVSSDIATKSETTGNLAE
jgi:non-ribosomal peptide synthetase component F